MLEIVYINMDAATERRAFMERQFEVLGLTAERLSAVTDPTFTAEQSELLRGRGPMSLGELGCFESHTQIWARCLQRQRPILALEDDTLLSPRLPTLLRSLESGLPDDADILRLETTMNVGRFGQARSIDGVTFRRVMQPQFCAAAYIVTPVAADWLLGEATPNLANIPVDLYLFDRPAIYSLRIWQAMPGLAVQPEFSRDAASVMDGHTSSLQNARLRLNTGLTRPSVFDRMSHYAALARFPLADLVNYRHAREVGYA